MADCNGSDTKESIRTGVALPTIHPAEHIGRRHNGWGRGRAGASARRSWIGDRVDFGLDLGSCFTIPGVERARLTQNRDATWDGSASGDRLASTTRVTPDNGATVCRVTRADFANRAACVVWVGAGSIPCSSGPTAAVRAICSVAFRHLSRALPYASCG